MKASRSIVRCGVLVRYWCQTWTAISETDEFADSVLGPEERVGRGVDVPDVEADAGAEDEGVAEGRLEGIVR
jgi:hypothetical protein